MILHDYDARKLQNECDELRAKLERADAKIDKLLWVCGGDAFGRDLLGYDYPMETTSDHWHWQSLVIGKVIDAAAKVAVSGRANCPLCGLGATDWGADRPSWERRDPGFTGARGWSIPVGLEMHLKGEGRTNECDVLKIAFARKLSENSDKFNAADDAAHQAKLAQQQMRLASEPTILVGPNGETKLRAETDYRDLETARTDWQPVELGLRDAEFHIETTGNVTAYRRVIGDQWMILADPRRASTITFRVFKRWRGKSWKFFGNIDLRGFKNLPDRLALAFDQRGIKVESMALHGAELAHLGDDAAGLCIWCGWLATAT